MRLRVICEGGPPEYAGRVWDDVEADDAGYLLFPLPGEDGPEAWYRIDPQENPGPASQGEALRALYIADYLPS
ncbi:MAG: hypothetical protein H0V23_02040 [Nocardioidaceae bacterium]|nr:hypothetical protein [Nocardioidaceae bacterium]